MARGAEEAGAVKMLRWMSAYPWVAPVAYAALVVALVWFGVWRGRRASEALGRAKADVVRLRADSVRAATAIHRVDSVFTRDTIRLTKAETRYRTVVDSVRRTDTLTVRESVIVSLADSTIRACREAITSCEARVRARDTMIRVIGEQRAADQRLFRARLAAANPRITPYAEALANPFDTRTLVARGGVEVRLFGPLRLVTALEYTTAPRTSAHALLGARVTF